MNRDRIIDWLYEQSVDHFLHWRRHLKEYFWAILVALTLRATVVTIYKIPTGSMIPTFREGDWLIANRFGYGLKIPFTDGLEGYKLPALKNPRPGDVVIFRSAGERVFEIHTVKPRNQKAVDLLLEINQDQTFPHAMQIEPGFTNTIVLGRLGADKNPGVSRRPSLGDERIAINLIKPLADKYRSRLNNPSDFITFGKPTPYIGPITTKEKNYPGLVWSILDTPISGVCILGTVAMNAPFGWALKLILIKISSFLEVEDSPTGLHLAHWDNFTLYPNPLVDTTKDYVKRMIADEGDTLEIINRQVFVNGTAHDAVGPAFFEDKRYGGENWIIQSNTMQVPGEKGNSSFTFPVRQRNTPTYMPGQSFKSNLWPFNPGSKYDQVLSGEYVHNFGPITVPKGHVFVMGDNRDNSLDSRFWGFVPKWAIKGQPMIRIFPFPPSLIH